MVKYVNHIHTHKHTYFTSMYKHVNQTGNEKCTDIEMPGLELSPAGSN